MDQCLDCITRDFDVSEIDRLEDEINEYYNEFVEYYDANMHHVCRRRIL